MVSVLFTACNLLFTTSLFAQQTLFLDDEATSVVLSGTSTFHDWEMPLQDGQISGSATFEFSEDGLTKLTGLEVSIEAEGLKSKSKGMNKDAYDALDTEQFPYITFKFAELKGMEKQATSYLIEVTGDLTISGVTKTVDLKATCTLNGKQKAICDGTYSLNMVDYGVIPPKTLLGLVKAGEEVTVVYHAVFVP
jgi:polyisoprenoid-binding protein YceI